MNRDDLVQSFQDTMAISESRMLEKRTSLLVRESKVYPEVFWKGKIHKPVSGERRCYR